MEIDPDHLDASQRYKLLIGGIVPRPIAFVSTLSESGIPNLAPFSFFTGVGSNPMSLLLCPSNTSDGNEKDTLRNAKPRREGGLGQFVVNAATESYARQMAAASEALPPDQSEFDLTGLTMSPSRVVSPPRLAESPLAYECETLQVIRLNDTTPGGPNILLGRVVHVFVDDELLNDRFHIDASRLAAVGRMGGQAYCRTGDRFELPFGRSALEHDFGP
jgi:flavin reductase (DIM6/NTAB) family NADH-FMN oxidoreductase RutF